MNKNYKKIKALIRKGNHPDPFSLGRYAFSPYQACGHGCIYCDGRAERYYIEGDFANDIIIRSNCLEILEKELPKLREKAFISLGSGVTDIYQPVEKELKIVRECAKLLVEKEYPVAIMTKSAMFLRDLDLWSELNKKSKVHLAVSLMTLDDEIRKIFEPGASSVQERLEMIRLAKAKGLSVTILALPLLPFISDNDENINGIFKEANKLQVDSLMPGGLTLRPGRQKDFYLETIREKYCDKYEAYRKLYIENKISGAGKNSYTRSYYPKFQKLAKQYHLPSQTPHYIYKKNVPGYDEVFLLLSHMLELYAGRGISTARLYISFKNYSEWLDAEKKIFNRKRKKTQDEQESEFRTKLENGELDAVFKNERLSAFIKRVILEEKIFDYNSLSL